jgi:hypothetical protein
VTEDSNTHCNTSNQDDREEADEDIANHIKTCGEGLDVKAEI